MSKVNITISYEEMVELFSKGTNEAFGHLMKKILDAFMIAESNEQIGATRYERSGGRVDYRNGTRERDLTTRIGKIELKVPRHRNIPFKTLLFENFQRNEAALVATMMEMVVQGVSTRKVAKVTEELCGTSFSKATVSEICKGLDEAVNDFKTCQLENNYPFLMVDAKYFKVREDHRVVSKALLVAMGITFEGKREIVGFNAFDNETKEAWSEFLADLKKRGLTNISMITSDAHTGLIAALKEVYPDVPWQRCQVHFRRNIIDKTPKKYQKGLGSELTEVFNAKSIGDARKRRDEILDDYRDYAPKAMEVLEEGFEAAMSVMLFPQSMRRSLRSTNLLERENGELGRRYDAIRIFPNTASLVRLMGSVLLDRHNALSSIEALWKKKKCIVALHEVKPQLLFLAREQIKLLKAA